MEFTKENKVINAVLPKLEYGKDKNVLTEHFPQFEFKDPSELHIILKVAEEHDLIVLTNKISWAKLTLKGKEINENNGWIEHLKSNIKESEKSELKNNLEIENLKLQKENLEYKESIRGKDEQILDLTKDSLRLGNWDIRFRWYIAAFGFLIGIITKYF